MKYGMAVERRLEITKVDKNKQVKQSWVDEWVHKHRANWTLRRLESWIKRTDRVVNLGAGDCRLDLMLRDRIGCEVIPVDVDDYNETNLELTLYDGVNLPFEDDCFDVVTLIFVLHHAEDPEAVLKEAKRVCRRHIIAFEDINLTWWDRQIFRGFHRFLKWSQGFPTPTIEWKPHQWISLAEKSGLKVKWQGNIGRQLGYFASRHVAYIWEKAEAPH